MTARYTQTIRSGPALNLRRGFSTHNSRDKNADTLTVAGTASPAAGVSFTTTATVADSTNNLAIFAVGDTIDISGAATNNGRFRVATSAAGTLTVVPAVVATNAAATTNVTIKRV